MSFIHKHEGFVTSASTFYLTVYIVHTQIQKTGYTLDAKLLSKISGQLSQRVLDRARTRPHMPPDCFKQVNRTLSR